MFNNQVKKSIEEKLAKYASRQEGKYYIYDFDISEHNDDFRKSDSFELLQNHTSLWDLTNNYVDDLSIYNKITDNILGDLRGENLDVERADLFKFIVQNLVVDIFSAVEEKKIRLNTILIASESSIEPILQSCLARLEPEILEEIDLNKDRLHLSLFTEISLVEAFKMLEYSIDFIKFYRGCNTGIFNASIKKYLMLDSSLMEDILIPRDKIDHFEFDREDLVYLSHLTGELDKAVFWKDASFIHWGKLL